MVEKKRNYQPVEEIIKMQMLQNNKFYMLICLKITAVFVQNIR